VNTSDSGTKQGHIKYLNRINSKKEIYKTFKIIAQDELTHVNGNEYQIIIISDLPNTRDNTFISSGDKTITAKRPSLRGYVNFIYTMTKSFFGSHGILSIHSTLIYNGMEFYSILLPLLDIFLS